ncbi:hypothetical protein Sps_00933 [Shewanella psychrophila]|uniref:Uncharacterized protein n=1 Tax=Shewanella psychrophila TaxID=225848 RepID=A0A1S6HKU0_9GAMM|nr:hypothetical protein [Shewanella psychrophila]AQS36122.1 hypothetical protein Sps_00933 [Shewanella psychrophila]
MTESLPDTSICNPVMLAECLDTFYDLGILEGFLYGLLTFFLFEFVVHRIANDLKRILDKKRKEKAA